MRALLVLSSFICARLHDDDLGAIVYVCRARVVGAVLYSVYVLMSRIVF